MYIFQGCVLLCWSFVVGELPMPQKNAQKCTARKFCFNSGSPGKRWPVGMLVPGKISVLLPDQRSPRYRASGRPTPVPNLKIERPI